MGRTRAQGTPGDPKVAIWARPGGCAGPRPWLRGLEDHFRRIQCAPRRRWELHRMTDAPNIACSQIRRDYFRDRWTLIAPGRANRTIETAPGPAAPAAPTAASCSFCPGRESETPPAVLRHPPVGDWMIRAFPNLYPALPHAHEVLVETPLHGSSLAALGPEHLELVLWALDGRLRTLYRTTQAAWVQAFKNQGAAAGASFGHAHSQLVATPFVPAEIAVKSAHSHAESCRYCAICTTEAVGPRLVAANRSFVAFCPVAPSWEGEVWLLARRHVRHLPRARSAALSELAALLNRVLRAVEAVTPAYNMMLFAAAPGMDLHFHVEIAPRREQALKAGLELATGISVVRQSPEDAAHAYRRWITEHDTAPRAATPTQPSPE